MLEQQDHISPQQPPTELEGIRQKVYIDRYSLKDASGQPLEHHPEDTWARVARGIAAVETTEEKRAYWEKRFYEALSNFQFVPGGRILAGAGSGHQVTFYNCFSAETLVHTREGLFPISTLQGEHAVLSDGGVYRTAFFKSYGKQQLWQVTLANGTTIHATPDHEWVVTRESGGTQRVLTRALAGRRIPVNPRPAPAYNGDFSEGVRHGIVYGDGSVQYGKAHVCLFDEKEQLASWFDAYRHRESGGTVATKEHVRIQALPAEWKALPAATASPSYWRGFVAGLIATDGHVDNRGSVAIDNHDKEALQQIAEGMALAGFVSSSITMTRETSPYDDEEKPVYRLQLFKASVNQRDILHPQHLEHFLASPQAKQASIEVVSVEETGRYEEVFCCVEPETHTITISHGYLTGQCYVIPSPEDSRQGILDNLKLMTEIMARGGGVGINLSTLRPRGSYIKTVNGTASGPCSWAQLYSVATGDVIQQGGSRRGALMLMLDDNHPDVEEFITVKRTAGKIEHANLSVCISDKFMQAVKDDADWDLIWNGEVKKTIRARSLWDLICTSAWESAEPGMVFMDRYNTESNTWYYEDIRCVNPCVTGDTLVYTDQGLLPAAELAELGTPIRIIAPDNDGVAVRQASHVFPTGVKPVYRLQTTEGYSVRLTGDHKVLTGSGWKAANELVTGEKLVLLNGEGGFGETGSSDLGMVLGWLVGDGCLNMRSDVGKSCVTLSFFGTEQVIAPHFAEAVNRLVANPEVNQRKRAYIVKPQIIEDRHETRVESVRLLRLIDAELLMNKLQVPPSVQRGSHEMQKGFLSALFTADGSVQGSLEKGASVRLTSVSQELLEGVQRLLLNFGIVSTIYKNRREPGTRNLPDGKGGMAAYECQAYHDLMISRNNLRPFARQIGFLTVEKQNKLEDLLAQYVRGPYREHFLATFESLTPDGEEMVYDLTEPEAHRFVGNGLTLHNCGEQGLPAFGVCNLGAINLSAFVYNGQMDYKRLAEMSKVAMRFLDNVVDANEYFIEENRIAQMGTRRTGLGTMGLADALIKMQIAYGSEESLPIIERIYSTIRDASYDASADNAAEKGAFTSFDRDKYMQGRFIKRLPKAVQDKIKKQGIRNAVLLTQAPTGTTSLLAGVSSGIEPVYDFAMIRRDRTGEHIMYHPLLQEWRDEHPNDTTPHYFVSSKDLTPEEHVRVQAMVQRYTDSSISKCVVGDTLVSSERGLLPIADLYAGEQPDTFRVLALHVASLKGTQLTSHFYFGGIKPTQRVKLADGHKITGTPNHQLYVGTPEGLMWKRLDELVPGDYVALKIGAQLFGTDVSLCGFQQSTVRSGYQKTISTPLSMNPVLAHFIGSYMAEGCIVHYTVRITNNEEGVLERLREESRLLFGLDGDITPQGKNNALTLQINSKSLCELLRFLGCEGNAAQKTIPWSILQSSRESIVAFLSGLYLDGFITETKVAICLASQELIQRLQIVFDNFGVQTWITVKHNTQYDRDYYELNAHGQEAQRILHLLTFDEAHKRERALKLLRREFQNNKSDIIPIETRKSVFADASRTVRYRHHSYSQALTQDCEGRMLSWFGLRRLANDPEVQLTPSLQEIWQESLHFRRVIAVEDSGEQPVYDLSVPSTVAFVGNGIVNHNTVNAPNEHTVEEVQKLYRLAYEMGCKGITYYRDGSRDAVLTRVEDEKKAAEQKQAQQAPMLEPVMSIQQGVKPRPAVVQGYTRQVNAPEGKINVTINSDEHGPLEVFVNVGKAGSDIAALAEALGRLISLNLRILSPLTQTDRAQEIADQLRGIGGSRSVGFGPQQVRSLPDAVARALELHMETLQSTQEELPNGTGNGKHTDVPDTFSLSKLAVTGNLCPQCGCNTMVNEEGCRKCYSCGHSEC